jgi:hypothetical protein
MRARAVVSAGLRGLLGLFCAVEFAVNYNDPWPVALVYAVYAVTVVWLGVDTWSRIRDPGARGPTRVVALVLLGVTLVAHAGWSVVWSVVYATDSGYIHDLYQRLGSGISVVLVVAIVAATEPSGRQPVIEL